MSNILHIEFENMLNLCVMLLKSACFSDIFSKFASRKSVLYYGYQIEQSIETTQRWNRNHC